VSAVSLLLLLDDVDEVLLDVDELLSSSSSTGGRAPPRRTVTGFGAAFRASRGDRRGLCCGCLLIDALFYVLRQWLAGRGRLRLARDKAGRVGQVQKSASLAEGVARV
jgi:hypothetical protein